MADIIAIVNQKGGVAKTTTTIHVGVALAHLGKKVLLVDLDSQGHLAEGFGIVADKIELEMSDVFEGAKSALEGTGRRLVSRLPEKTPDTSSTTPLEHQGPGKKAESGRGSGSGTNGSAGPFSRDPKGSARKGARTVSREPEASETGRSGVRRPVPSAGSAGRTAGRGRVRGRRRLFRRRADG